MEIATAGLLLTCMTKQNTLSMNCSSIREVRARWKLKTLQDKCCSERIIKRLRPSPTIFLTRQIFVLGLGSSVPIGKHLKLNGNVSVVIPFSTIYDSGVVTKQVYINSGQPAPDAKVNLLGICH
ncbi:MAG: hypothetical protein ACKODM_09580 [Cytophagales bacterium]